MRYADCQGSYKCTFEKCPFRVEFEVVNGTQIMKNKEGINICRICGHEAVYVPCPRRQYIQKGKKNIQVFHWGEHTCPVISKPEKPTKKIREMLEENLKLNPSEEGDWYEVENAANRLLDKKWIKTKNKT